MKHGLGILAVAMLLGGCAAQPKEAASPLPNSDQLRYRPATAAALAVDPPILAGTPRLDLSREGRDVQAFVGFEEPSATFYDIEVNDYQEIDHGPNTYQNWSVSDRTGVNYR